MGMMQTPPATRLMRPKHEWEFDVLGIYNYRLNQGALRHVFNFIRDNCAFLDGNIVEVGVFRGRTTLALGLLLSEIAPCREVIGFDSFSGFPNVLSNEDSISQFDLLLANGHISQSHYDQAIRYWSMRSHLASASMDPMNISSSGTFACTSKEMIEAKVRDLGLTNIELVTGDFDITMPEYVHSSPIMCAVMDCDLYRSHTVALSHLWPNLVAGGMLYLDEYYSLKFPGARTAIIEFLSNTPTAQLLQLPSRPDEFERWCIIKH